ncbi:hypothetical protein GC194_15240 [bacterium]|nr:hypothetical protein [bacterium]
MKVIFTIIPLLIFLVSCGSNNESKTTAETDGTNSISSGNATNTMDEDKTSSLAENENGESTEEANSKDEEEAISSVDNELLLAQKEQKIFANRVSIAAENVSKRLLSKYEYILTLKNENKVLSVVQVEIKVDFLSKDGENLGTKTIRKNITIKPNGTNSFDWSIDWINLEEGTKTCEFSIVKVESNISEFEKAKDVNA